MMIGWIIVGTCAGIVAWLFAHFGRLNAEISSEAAAQEPPKTPEERIEDLRAFSGMPGLSRDDAAAALESLRQIKLIPRRSWWQRAKEWVFGKVSEKGEA